MAQHYALLLDALAEELPDTTVVVNSVLPVATTHNVSNESIQALNVEIEKLCEERNLEFIDLYDAFVGEDGGLKAEYDKDSVHLLAEGYRVWLSYLTPVLDQYL